jgi:hypothetical protein
MLEQDTPEVPLSSDLCTGEDRDLQALHSEPLIPSSVYPLVAPGNREAFFRVAQAFAEAERRIKRVEWMGGLDVPSINELRYVSYHLLKACQIQDDEKRQFEELRRAERHCKRASFDALELGIITALEEVKSFRESYSSFPVSDVLSDYHDMMTDVQSTADFLAEAAGGEFRDDYYEDCEQKLGRLQDITRKLSVASEEINKKKALFEREQQRTETAEARADRAESRADTAEERADKMHRLARMRLLLAVVAIVLGVGFNLAQHLSAEDTGSSTEVVTATEDSKKAN